MDAEKLAVGKGIDVLGVHTNYFDLGTGEPLLLLHGSGLGVSAYANWGRTMPVFADHFRVIAPDVAGFGYSDPPEDTSYSLDYWVQHTVALLDVLGIARTSIIGNSFGGALAVALTVQHPERVHRVLLMGSTGVDFVPPEVFSFDLSKGLTQEVMTQIVQLFTVNPEIITGDMVELRLQTALRPQNMKRQTRLFPGDAKVSRVTSLLTRDDHITSIEHPVLLVHGRNDQIVPLTTSRRFHELLPNADLHIFANCGHWSQLDRAADFNALAISFLGQD
jgi:pimeloyl-ACP methyl ester carboxylesterase